MKVGVGFPDQATRVPKKNIFLDDLLLLSTN